VIANPVDLFILAVLAVSFLLGIFRGFVREVLSLIGWIAGIVAALVFADDVGAFLLGRLPWPPVRTALAAIAIVAACVFAAGLLGWAARRVLEAAKLSAADRALGGAFGLLRGGLFVAAGVALGTMLGLARHPAWRGSALLPPAEAAVRWLGPMLVAAGLPVLASDAAADPPVAVQRRDRPDPELPARRSTP